MHIDNISSNNFRGKFIIPQKLPKKEQEFAEQLIDYWTKGVSNKEYLKGKNFDVNILSASKKRRTPRKLAFSVGLKYIGTKGTDRGVDITQVDNEVVYVDKGLWDATYYLRSFIDRTDKRTEDLPTQYNSKFQKFLVKTAMFLGIF